MRYDSRQRLLDRAAAPLYHLLVPPVEYDL
jgi:hypothetical protein